MPDPALSSVSTDFIPPPNAAQFQEADIIQYLEDMCDPDSKAGEWITAIDLQEKEDELHLVEMGKVCNA